MDNLPPAFYAREGMAPADKASQAAAEERGKETLRGKIGLSRWTSKTNLDVSTTKTRTTG